MKTWDELVKIYFHKEKSNSNFGFLKKVASIGVNNWEAGDYSEQKYMVLNGAWDSNWDEVEEARKGLGEVIDNLLCSAFDWKIKIIHYSAICLLYWCDVLFQLISEIGPQVSRIDWCEGHWRGST